MPRIPLTEGRPEEAEVPRGFMKGMYQKNRIPTGQPKFMRIGANRRLDRIFREKDAHERATEPAA